MITPAPDLETIFDLEGQIEPGLQRQLQSLGIDQVQIQNGTANQTSGRVDVQLTLGAATGHLYVPANLPDGEFDTRTCLEDAWLGTLALTITTNRGTNPTTLHPLYVAKVRALMAQFFTQFPCDVLPYHEIAYARTAGTTIGVNDERQQDMTELRYACEIVVRAGAWPAGY